MMILFHYAFDLRFFYRWNIDVFSGPWFWLGRLCAILFLLLVGISFVISWDRSSRSAQAENAPAFREVYPKYLRRGLFILGCGMLITAVTYGWMPRVYIRFGILHLIGTSILILPFFVRLREANVLVALILIATGQWMPIPRVETGLLLPLGIPHEGFASLDYYPLLPWFGVILLGSALGHLFYIRYPQWRIPLSSRSGPEGPSGPRTAVHFPLSASLGWPGRNALLIYMLHQPIILGFLHFMI